MRITQDFIKYNNELEIISNDEFEKLKQKHGITLAYKEDEIKDCIHPMKKIVVIQNEDKIGANESDPVGSYALIFAFKYKGKYYLYSDCG